MSTKFENDIPIDDSMVVLDLLCRRWGDGSTREIERWDRDEPPYITIGHHHDFSDSTYYRFQLTKRVVEELMLNNFVRGKPEWGYTDTKRLSVSDVGEQMLWNARSELKFDEHLRSDWWLERKASR